jgi:hypothetical protein
MAQKVVMMTAETIRRACTCDILPGAEGKLFAVALRPKQTVVRVRPQVPRRVRDRAV